MSKTTKPKRKAVFPWETQPLKPGESVLRGRTMARDQHDAAPGGRTFAGRWGGMNLTRVPQTPAAQNVFSESELAARLDAMGEQMRNEEGERKYEPARCWCCDAVCPNGHYVGVGLSVGWVSRPLPGLEGVTEVYCPKCFEEWGWADGRDGEG